ncbi:hypothetical protein LVJ94_02615 [Pendulispora rubella]|uniref:Uncharacterized protein n=1 Tax=Pendulispora rubella TaxID=2741070 RepID=A0ABZ2L5V1_9BACT
MPTNVAAWIAACRVARWKIAYVERGTGDAAPALLFLRALPLNGYQWRDAVDRLFADRRRECERFCSPIGSQGRTTRPPKVAPAIEAARAGNFPDTWLKPSPVDKSFARGPQGLGGAMFTYPSRLADGTLDCYSGPLVSSPERKALVNAYLLGLDPNPLAGVEAALKKCAVPARILWGNRR